MKKKPPIKNERRKEIWLLTGKCPKMSKNKIQYIIVKLLNNYIIIIQFSLFQLREFAYSQKTYI